MENQTKKLIKNLLIDNNITIKDLAELMSTTLCTSISRASLSRKINSETIQLREFLNILDILNCELEIRKRYTK